VVSIPARTPQFDDDSYLIRRLSLKKQSSSEGKRIFINLHQIGVVCITINPFTRSRREKDMKKQWFVGVVGLGAMLFCLSEIPSAVGEISKSGGDEKPAMVTSETVSFATEDWVGAKEEAPGVAMETPSFGTEDWVPEIALSEGERPVMEAMETPSFATEDWVGAQEEAPVVAMDTPSFATEDWVGAQEEAPVVAMETPSFATEDWVEASVTSLQVPIDWAAAFNEYYDVVEIGALPSAVHGEPWTGDNYSE
jgi:hypothetical protein